MHQGIIGEIPAAHQCSGQCLLMRSDLVRDDHGADVGGTPEVVCLVGHNETAQRIAAAATAKEQHALTQGVVPDVHELHPVRRRRSADGGIARMGCKPIHSRPVPTVCARCRQDQPTVSAVMESGDMLHVLAGLAHVLKDLEE